MLKKELYLIRTAKKKVAIHNDNPRGSRRDPAGITLFGSMPPGMLKKELYLIKTAQGTREMGTDGI